MKFFNRYILLFTAIIAVWTAIFYSALMPLVLAQKAVLIIIASIIYGLGMFAAGRGIGARDIYKGNIGFNYHFMTYVVCVSAAWIVKESFSFPTGALAMTLTWGIGIAIHFFIWLALRKKNVRGFDKDELFE